MTRAETAPSRQSGRRIADLPIHPCGRAPPAESGRGQLEQDFPCVLDCETPQERKQTLLDAQVWNNRTASRQSCFTARGTSAFVAGAIVCVQHCQRTDIPRFEARATTVRTRLPLHRAAKLDRFVRQWAACISFA